MNNSFRSISSSLTPFSRRDRNNGADRLDVARWWICSFSHSLLRFFQVCQSHTLPAQSKNKTTQRPEVALRIQQFLGENMPLLHRAGKDIDGSISSVTRQVCSMMCSGRLDVFQYHTRAFNYGPVLRDILIKLEFCVVAVYSLAESTNIYKEGMALSATCVRRENLSLQMPNGKVCQTIPCLLMWKYLFLLFLVSYFC